MVLISVRNFTHESSKKRSGRDRMKKKKKTDGNLFLEYPS